MKSINTKFALYEYSTENIGDEVQSIAARRFLPKVDYYVDRDELADFSPKKGDKVKLIMNGWYMHKPSNWPPKSNYITPLLVSMYVDQKNPATVAAFTNKESKQFFQEHGPVGARDKATQKFLNSNGIESYFSGCLTLTLKRDERFERGEFILLVDVSKEVEATVRAATKRPVVVLSVYRTPNLSQEDKFVLAEYYLYLYQSAFAVVTTRLHTMLPSLAFETPVALIKEKDKFEPNRYEGLADLVYSFNEQDFINNPSIYNVNKPPKNKPDYLELREQLIKKSKDFTGYEADTYLTIDLSSIYKNVSFARIVGEGSASTYKELLRIGDTSWLNEVARDLEKHLRAAENAADKNKKQADQLESDLNMMRNSLSWKITAPLRSINNRVRGGS